MKTFIAKHNGAYLGGFSIVTSGSKKTAEKLVKDLLIANSLSTEDIELEEVNTKERNAVLILNGDY